MWSLDLCLQGLRAGTELPEVAGPPGSVPPSYPAAPPVPCQPGPHTESKGCPAFVSVYDHVPGHGNTQNNLTYDFGQDVARATATSPTGSAVYVTGTSVPSPEATDTLDYVIATVAYDPVTGEQEWVARYDGPTGAYDDPSSLVVSPDGATVYVGGVQGLYRSDPPEAVVLAYEAATGELLWSSAYAIPGDEEGVYDGGLAVSPDGRRLVVAATVARTDGTVDLLTYALDTATGGLLWDAIYASPDPTRFELAAAAGITSDGRRAVVAATSYDNEGVNDDYLIVSYNLEECGDGTGECAAGARQWVTTFDSQWQLWDVVAGLAVNPAGSGVAVTGYSRSTPDFGEILNNTQNEDWATLLLDEEDGSVRWVRRFTSLHRGYNRPMDLVFSPGGDRLYVTGNGTSDLSPHDYEFKTTAYVTSTGSTATGISSNRSYGRPGGLDIATSVAVSRDGTRLYVSGYSGAAPLFAGSPVFIWARAFIWNNFPLDAATVAYDVSPTDLTRAWVARYSTSGGPADTVVPVGAAVAPDGSRVYLAAFLEYRVDPGHVDPPEEGRTNFYDYGLIAYTK